VKTFQVSTDRREMMVDVTDRVNRIVAEAGVDEAICLVYSPHTTCAITVNEGWDPDVQADALDHLRGLIPREAGFAHSEGNSDSHIKSMAIGTGATVPVSGGRLCLGRWQAVFLCEFDGPRQREVWVQLR
jgi:secondary thiamine-phosphate synthase enzyme